MTTQLDSAKAEAITGVAAVAIAGAIVFGIIKLVEWKEKQTLKHDESITELKGTKDG